jgi:N-acetyltransferase
MQPLTIPLQPSLKNNLVIAEPLQSSHFNALYAAAADPLIWEQHPNKNRWQLPDFEIYFQGAIASGGALLVMDAATNEIIGCSRYYDYNAEANNICIGYTFLVRSHWGSGYNYALKQLMLDHIFPYVHSVRFFIGAFNKRSQISIERFGAIKTREEETAYYGEAPKLDYVYEITKEKWDNKFL